MTNTGTASLSRSNRALRLLSQCNHELVRAQDEAVLLHAICRLAVEGGGYRLAWVGFAENDENKSVRVVAQAGFDDGYLDRLRITWSDSERGRGPSGMAIRTGRIQIANNITADPRMAPWRSDAMARGYRSSISLPLKADGHVIGALMVYAQETDAFDADEARLLTELADDLAFGIVTLRTRRERQRAEEALRLMARDLRESEQRFRQIAENILDHVISLQDVGDLRFSYVSPAYENIWGRSIESLYADASEWIGAIHPDDRARTQAEYQQKMRTTNFELEFRIVRPDGTIRWIHATAFPVRDESGTVARIAGVSQDVTARKEAEARIAYLNRVQAMLSGINAIIVRSTDRGELFDEACRIAVEKGGFRMAWMGVVNRASKKMTIVTSAGADAGILAAIQDRWSLQESTELERDAAARLIDEGETVVANDAINDPMIAIGQQFARAGIRSLALLPLVVAGKTVGLFSLHATETDFFHREEIALLNDVAGNIAFGVDHLDKQARLDYLAYYDVLTGLANRALFLERVAQHLRSMGADHQLAILLVDIERFKKINDAFGASIGDQLLRQVGQWLVEATGDTYHVARVAADQFALVMPGLRQTSDLANRLDDIMTAFSDHAFPLGDEALRLAIKGGIALFPDDGSDAGTLFMNAEAALKKAKATGERYLFYAPRMTAAVASQIALENQLRRALDEDQFVLHYQPKVDLASGRVTGVEALIRWNDPRNGLVPPGQFIPVLEETGLINDVGRWALRHAMQDYVRWCNAGFAAVPIAVNVSPLQLRNRHFVDEIRQAIGIDSRAAAGLELEITESLIMEDVVHSVDVLSRIRALGVTIAIDDFGTGFSSLSYLAKLPVDRLKVDRSFVVDMMVAEDGMTLVSMIVTLAHAMKLKVAAEGVETQEQSDLLRAMGCDEMQGFLFSRPVPIDVLEAKYLAPQRD